MKLKKAPLSDHLPLSAWFTLSLLLLSNLLSAAPLTWDGNTGTAGLQDGGGNWNTTDVNRWHNGSGYEPWTNSAGTPNSAIFGVASGAGGTVTLTEAILADDLTFNASGSGAYTIASSAGTSTLTLIGADTPVITANVAATISAVLDGTNGLTKAGAGNLILSGGLANKLTGTANVTAGSLTLSKTAGVNAIAGDVLINGGTLIWTTANQVADTATITMTSGGLQLANQTETFKSLLIQGGNSNANTSSNSGFLTLTDTLGLSGTGTLGMNSGGQWSANTIAITGGTRTAVTLTGNSAVRISRLTVGPGGLSMTGQTISLNKGTAPGTPMGSELFLNGNVTTSGANAINFGGNGGGAGRVNLGSNIITWEVAAPVGAEITNIATAIVGDGGLTKTGAGVLNFSSADANTYTGMTTVSNGTLRLAKSGGTTAIAGDITVSGGILDWDAANMIADTSSLFLTGGSLKFDNLTETFANLIQTGGTINNSGNTNSGIVNITGTLRMSAGTGLSLNSGGQWTVGKADFTGFSGSPLGLNGNSATTVTRLTIGAGGLVLTGQTLGISVGTDPTAKGSDIVLNGDVTASGSNNFTAGGTGGGVSQINLGGQERTWNITSGTTSSAAAFVGAGGGIRKTGTGILALNAAATYTGKTTVDGGTFRLGNAVAAIDDSPWLEVNSGATFANATGASYVFDGVISGTGSLTGNMIIGDNRGLVSGTGVLRPGGSSDPSSLATAGDLRGTITFANDLVLGAPTSPAINIVRGELQITGATGNAAGSFTGNVASWVAGIPAAHAALVTGAAGNHDHIEVSGRLTLNEGGGIEIVNPGNAYTPVFGDVFNLIDWGSLTNNDFTVAADLSLPDISGSGLAWDTSLFLSHGSIVVVPEPGRMLLVGLGLLGLGMRRRRSGVVHSA